VAPAFMASRSAVASPARARSAIMAPSANSGGAPRHQVDVSTSHRPPLSDLPWSAPVQIRASAADRLAEANLASANQTAYTSPARI
jgi:hypothetical protein